MAQVIRSFSNLLAPNKLQVPSGRSVIDWTHPLVRGMVDCVVMCYGKPVNLINNYNIGFSGAPQFQITPDGSSVYSNNGANGFQIPDRGSYVAGDGAMRLRFMAKTWPNNFTRLCNKGDGGGSSATDQISIFFSATGVIDWIIWGGGGAVALGNFPTNKVHDLVLSRSGPTLTVYQNGVSLGTAANGTSSGTILPFSFGPGTQNVNPNAYYITVQIWNRSLTVSEVVQLSADPYGFLLSDEGEMQILFPTTPPSVLYGQNIGAHYTYQTTPMEY